MLCRDTWDNLFQYVNQSVWYIWCMYDRCYQATLWRHVSGGDLSLILGSLPPSILLSSLPSCRLSMGSRLSPLTRCETFWCNLYSQTALWNPHWWNQHACRVQPLSAELILWITCYIIAAWHQKVGVCAHLDHHCRKVMGSGPLVPHRIAATAWSYHMEMF